MASRHLAVRPVQAEARLLRGRDGRLPEAVSELLPAGTVTFLFCDVEASTRLMRALGDEWGRALGDYRRIMRETAEGAGGREVDSQGDGMFLVFPRARVAVAAAAQAQRRLAEHEWPQGAQLQVRMGLHTGEPGVGEEGYLGLDVVRAARIAASAHGGQILLSATTQALVAGDPLEGIGTIYLGEHRLKDIPAPEHVHQLVVAGQQTRFDSLRELEEAPPEPVQFAGREREVAREIEDAVRDLRTSIEQHVADSLRRGAPTPGDAARRRVRYEDAGPTGVRAALVLAGVTVIAILGTIVLIVWLIAG